MSERFIILPDLTTISEDAAEYRENHFDLFGHYPPRDPQDRCDHPMHAAMRREMNDANVVVLFDSGEVESEDAVSTVRRKGRYDHIFEETRQWQKEIEETERENALRKAGIIVPGKVY